MTIHDRDKVIAIAEQVKANNDMFGDFSVALYAIAFEDGRCKNWRNEMTDEQLASRVREELYFGCVEAAEQFASSIEDEELRCEMRAEIRRYEGSDE